MASPSPRSILGRMCGSGPTQLSLLVSQSGQDRSLPRVRSWQRTSRQTHSLAALVTYIDAILAMAPITCEDWNREQASVARNMHESNMQGYQK